jgi:hypothetical protein
MAVVQRGFTSVALAGVAASVGMRVLWRVVEVAECSGKAEQAVKLDDAAV